MTTTARLNLPKTIAILIFIAAAATLLHPAFAQDATTGATTKKQILQQRIDTRKTNVDNRITAIKDKMASREAVLKAKLDAFKDRRKAEIANRVNTNLNKINQNQTGQMKKHLDLMTSLLDKLEARVNTASRDIKDPTAVRSAITSARATIATTSATVVAQSQKDYIIAVTSESKVRADAQTMRDQLKTDIQAVRKLVIDAKQSVSSAVRVAQSGKLKEGTTSGQQ